jgi:hypothetical protein
VPFDETDNIAGKALGRLNGGHMTNAGILDYFRSRNFLRHELAGLDEEIVLLAVYDQNRTGDTVKAVDYRVRVRVK